MTSLLVRISWISGRMSRRSLPAINGAASIAHRLKCERYSVSLILPLPTSSMSGSFQCPGPAYDPIPTCSSRIASTPFEQQPPFGHFSLPPLRSLMSSVVRHKFPPISFPHSHGFAVPHSQMLSTIGRPEASSALRMLAYEAFASCVLVLHQSYFR